MAGTPQRRRWQGVALAGALAAVPLSMLADTAVAQTPASEAEAPGRSFAQPLLRPSTFPSDVAPAIAAPSAATIERTADTPAEASRKRMPPKVEKSEKSWPKTIPDAKAEVQPPIPDVYAADEIAAGRAHCANILKGLDVVVVEEPPFKTGVCGAAAPVQLVSIGSSPQVALSPPVTVTCDVVAAMHKWVTGDVQQLAKKHLGSQVIGITTMSSYSCRNAYGRKRTNLSEHGRANAIDIRGFITTDAKEVVVLNDWGPTAWEIRAQIAAAAKAAAEKAAAEKVAAEKLAAEKAAKQRLAAPGGQAAGPPAVAATQPAPSGSASSSVGNLVKTVPGMVGQLPGAAIQEQGGKGFGLTKPSNLGGPKGGDLPAAATEASVARRAIFLRDAHDAACRIFGTTLGPETNVAHKNHFHVDMAERTRGNYCE